MDYIDRKIVSILRENGRTTMQEIAREVGLSVMGVKKRLKRLEGMVKVRALVDTESLVLALIAMEVEDSKSLNEIIEKFRECPRIIKFFVTVGGYNLFALIWVDDYHTLESVSLEKCSIRAQKGIRRFEIFPVREVHYDPFFDLRLVVERTSEYAPCGVHCGSCERYEAEKCAGCPATKFYRGIL